MANRFTVWTDLRVRGTGLTKEVGKARRAFGGLAKSIARTKDIAKGVLIGGGLYAGLAQIGLGVRSVTDDFIGLDHSITSAGARFGDAFNRGTAGFDRLTAAARETGAVTEHTAAQAGDGLSFMAMAGFTAAESMALLPDIADLATAANLDFARSSDIASDALGAFGKNTGTAEEKASAFKNIMDQAAKSTNTANMDLNMWFESIRESAPSFVAGEQRMSTLNTVISELANNGKKGATSGYMLRSMINRLAAPVGKGKTALKKMNIQVAETDGSFRDLLDIMEDLGVGLDKMGSVKRTKAIKEIFGERAVAGMNILFAKGADGLKKMRTEIEDNAGAAGNLANKMRGSVQNRIAKIKSAATEMGLKLFDAFGPKIESGIASTTNWLDEANENSVGWVRTLTDLADTLATTAKWLFENRELAYGLVKAYMGFKAAGIVMEVSKLATGWANVSTEIVGATSKVSGFQSALSGINAVVIGASIGLAIGNAIWQVLEAKSKKREAAATAKGNRGVMASRGLSRAGTSGTAYQIGQAENAILEKWKGQNLAQIEGRIDQGKTEGYGQDIMGDIKMLKRARKRKAELLEEERLGRFGTSGGMFGSDFNASPMSQMGAGAGAVTVQPSFDVYINNTTDVDGNVETAASVVPKTGGPTPNNAGALP